MKLALNGIDVECIIGELPEERTRPQRLVVDVELEIGDEASFSDRLEDTVDYAALADRVRAALTAAKCRMIERAARVVLEECMADGRVAGAEVRVTKAGAVAHLASATAVLSSPPGRAACPRAAAGQTSPLGRAAYPHAAAER